ncbi:6234_t:CDS:1, partial [Funneliformis caledonium]
KLCKAKNVVTRGENEIHRYYHLHSSEIPVYPIGEYNLANFVKTLLILQ